MSQGGYVKVWDTFFWQGLGVRRAPIFRVHVIGRYKWDMALV